MRRVKEAGLSENEAKTRICQAIAAGIVAVRFKPIYSSSKGAIRFAIIPNLFVSPQLDPGELDWMQSRPLTRSSIGPMLGLSGSWTDRDPVTLELWTSDVIEVLCGGVNEISSENEKPPVETEAINSLALLLREKRNLKRADARLWCEGQGFKLSGVSFKIEFGRTHEKKPDWIVGPHPVANQNRCAKSLHWPLRFRRLVQKTSAALTFINLRTLNCCVVS